MIRRSLLVAVVIVLVVPAIAMALATLTVSPRSIAFGERCVDSTSNLRTITIDNEGDGEARDVSVAVEPTTMADVFTLSGATEQDAIAPDGSFALSVGFTPRAPGRASAKAVVRYGAMQPSPTPSPTKGGKPGKPSPSPTPTPTPRSTSIALSGAGLDRFASVSPRAVAFGTLRRGRTSSRTVTIFNDGTEPLTISSTAVAGRHAADFRFRSRPEPSLDPGESTDLRLTFAPKAAGARAAELLIRTNACEGSPLRVPLGGQLIEPAIRIDPERLDFGTRIVGTTRRTTITINNDGEDTLRLRSIDFESEVEGVYRLDGYPKTFPVRIAPHKGKVMTLVFKASRPGVLKATLTVRSNDPDERVLSKEVFGAGIEPAPSKAPAAAPTAPDKTGGGFDLDLGPYLSELLVIAIVSAFFGSLIWIRRVRGIPE